MRFQQVLKCGKGCSDLAVQKRKLMIQDSIYDRVAEAARWLQGRLGTVPRTAIILGSGLGGFTDRFEDALSIPYAEIPNWPPAGVAGHAGRLVAGSIAGREVIAVSGRVHLYEGLPPSEVVFPVRALGLAGVNVMILTNAAGGLNTGFAPGSLMVIDDHVNMMGANPLAGANDERLGPRFPDMSEVYSRRLRKIADEAAEAIRIRLEHGVYLAVHGPSYETPAETRVFRLLGADAVGMSTVPEAIAARQMGIELLGISCITNVAADGPRAALDHAEVLGIAARVRPLFTALLEAIVRRLR